MQLPTVHGRHTQPGRPSTLQSFVSHWLRLATLIWVAGAIAFTVPRQSIEKAPTPTFLPPMPDAGEGVIAEPQPLAQRL